MQALSQQYGFEDTTFAEYTINQRIPQLMREIYRQSADCLIFSCYIWNIEMVLAICEEYKTVAPETKLILAGPEVSYDSRALLERHSFVDGILRGEGEPSLLPFLQYLHGDLSVQEVPSFTGRDSNKTIFETTAAEPLDLAKLPFPYFDLSELEDRILYFEASRGCPFQCGYCLSSVERGVRFLPLDLVFSRMDCFLEHRVRQVKFVDRTFNCKKSYALAIWRYLAEHDNGVTNFHFEIAGDLLDEECLEFLQTVRKGQFQFEVGVQSTNPQTLESITRKTNIDALLETCRRIDSFGNIHLHLDLIAGLPWEDLPSFAKSFNRVFSIRPQQLQLGFLKLLKGSAMHCQAEAFGISASRRAPYEILFTRWLSYDDLLFLKDTESMVETFYNSGRFTHVLELILPHFDTPFAFFSKLGLFFTEMGYHRVNHSKERFYEILREFCLEEGIGFSPEQEQLCLLDLCLHEKPKKLPAFLSLQQNHPYRDWIREFYENEECIREFLPAYAGEDPRRLSKITHLQVFPFAVVPEKSRPFFSMLPGDPTPILFDYAAAGRNLTGRAHMRLLHF